MMQGDEPLDEGEAYAQAALGAIKRALSLDEQVEYVGQEFGCNAEPVVLHAQHRLVGLHGQCNGDFAARSRVLHCVADDVGNNLFDAYRIAFDPDGCRRNFELVWRLALGEDRGGSPHEVAKIEHAPLESDFAGHDATDIEQVIHQPRQVLNLPPNDEPRTRSCARVCFCRFQHLDRRGDGTERIAQLVCQHRHELVLGLALLLGAIAATLRIQQLAEIGNDEISPLHLVAY
ncbi:MAG TPA: hypothetical protein VGO18_35590 [Steroidobacteraceae bacterium]|nr:hypothetical protein [Steroidobacteraceae bacterium]